MANTPTTPASVASRLTDEELEAYAIQLESSRICTPEKMEIAAVMRDYVRLRRENCELRKCLKETKEIVCDDCETENCETCTRNMEWRNLQQNNVYDCKVIFSISEYERLTYERKVKNGK